MKDHIWEPNRNWGYVQFNSSEDVTNEYIKYANQLYDLIARGSVQPFIHRLLMWK